MSKFLSVQSVNIPNIITPSTIYNDNINNFEIINIINIININEIYINNINNY